MIGTMLNGWVYQFWNPGKDNHGRFSFFVIASQPGKESMTLHSSMEYASGPEAQAELRAFMMKAGTPGGHCVCGKCQPVKKPPAANEVVQ